jgi:hypothetical protein
VAEWVKVAFPQEWERREFLFAVLAWSRPGDGATSIPLIIGLKHSAKTTLFKGLSFRVVPAIMVERDEIFSGFALNLRKTFLMFIDEALPSDKASDVDKIMTLCLGNPQAVNTKHGSLLTATGNHRLAIAANNEDDILDQIRGQQQMSGEKSDALMSRLAIFRMSPETPRFLGENIRHTEGWVESLRIIQHFLWEEQQLLSQGFITLNPDGTFHKRGRFVYEYPQAHRRSDVEPTTMAEMAVVKLLTKMFDPVESKTFKPKQTRIEGTKLVISASDIEDYADKRAQAHPSEREVNSQRVGYVLRRWGGAKERGHNNTILRVVDIRTILEKALSIGINLPDTHPFLQVKP